MLRPLSWYGKFDETGRLITGKDGKSIVRTTPDVVVKARLRLHEVVAVILYTGPMYWIWNTVLRGKEACPPIQWTVWERCVKHRNLYSSSLHILGSAIKKIQQSGVGLREDMMLYRGLSGGKLPEQMFKPDEHGRLGMAEYGVTSTTSNLGVAIEYSGANAGKMATVLAVRTTQVDSAACLTDFSQYPYEKEFLWLARSYVQLIKGREEIIANEHGQLVRILQVTINANARTLTIEELEAQRKMIVVPMLNLMHTAMCQNLDNYASTEEFKKRLHLDWHADEFGPGKKRDFLQRIKDEALERVQFFTTKSPEWFLVNHNLGHAVACGLALPKLAEDKLTLWLFEKTLQLSRFRSCHPRTHTTTQTRLPARMLTHTLRPNDIIEFPSRNSSSHHGVSVNACFSSFVHPTRAPANTRTVYLRARIMPTLRPLTASSWRGDESC